MGSGSSIAKMPDNVSGVEKDGRDLQVSKPACGCNKKIRSSSASKVKPATTACDDISAYHQDNALGMGQFRKQENNLLQGDVKKIELVQSTAEKEAKLLKMEKQMAELEAENFNLQDQLANLENQIEFYKNANAINEQNDCDETLRAKDQYIEKLEGETKAVQEEINKLRIRFKKKLRAANAQIAEAKQGNSLKVYEMKNEMARLKEENDKLEDNIKHRRAPFPDVCDSEAGAIEIPEDNRTRIILDLSSKISEQDTKINQLQRQLSERDRQIENLQLQINTRSQVEHGPSEKTDGVERADTGSKELSELKQIAAEMKKLKKKKKAKTNNGREFSGTSRDSGVNLTLNEESSTFCLPDTSIPRQKDADGWDSDSDSPSPKDLAKQGHGNVRSKTSPTSDLGDTDTDYDKHTSLDPSSIRRISAPRRRAKTQFGEEIENTVDRTVDKPPVPRRKAKCLADDMDALIQSIDDDIMCVNNGTNAQHRPTIVSH